MSKWKVLTPKTSFPLRTKPVSHEISIQETVNFQELYKWQESTREGNTETFTLHDGPPYANGSPHMGHVLNKVLKDFVNRYKILKGYKVHYRPGWDCHGLPIELKACQNLSRNTEPLLIRKTAKEFAKKAIEIQQESFKRWGVLGDWTRPYLTMDGTYESNQINLFYRMYERGCIYRGHKPVYWSPSSHTALAEAELEYKDHTSTSVYLLFPSFFPNLPHDNTHPVYSLVWTTTPWTLPLNKAICYNPSHEYSLIQLDSNKSTVLVGTQQLTKLEPFLGSHKILDTIQGKALSNGTYINPLTESTKKPFLEGLHVTSTEGTGLVHTAPAHGFDDYDIGSKHGLDLTCYVDQNGRYTDDLDETLKGLNVLSTANNEVINRLKMAESLLHVEPFVHRYPYDWRTNKPVIIRSTKQWFASVHMLRETAIQALRNVIGTPKNAIPYMEEMVGSRSEWCISRQRVWGVPIPVFYRHDDHDEVLINEESINHLKELFSKYGSDCWWALPIAELLPPSLKGGAESYRTGTDTMDVWFDSGSSWASVLADNGGVADMYLEGSDQYRGWFQSSLLTSVASHGTSPYRRLVSHGFVLDAQGNKMSKSLGNVITPDEIINERQLGADTMRLWASAGDFKKDTPISYLLLDQTNEFLQKIRNTLRFMIGNLAGFDAKIHSVPYTSLPYLDRYQLHLLAKYFTLAESSYENLNFSKLYHSLVDFIPQELSAFYFDIVKDRLYCESASSPLRRSSLTVMYYLLRYLTLSIAPIVPHLTEEVNIHYPFTDKGSIFKVQWPQLPTEWYQPQLGAEFSSLCELRHLVNRSLAVGRTHGTIRSFLEAQVCINTNSKELDQLLKSRFEISHERSHDIAEYGYSLREFLGVSKVQLNTNSNLRHSLTEFVMIEGKDLKENVQVYVSMDRVESNYEKCSRCWKYSHKLHNVMLCERCSLVETINN